VGYRVGALSGIVSILRVLSGWCAIAPCANGTRSPQISQNEKGSLRFLAKWGCDGASGYSKYNQSFSDKALSDESIFMISMVPLKLEIKTSFGWKVVWKNERPSSTKFCRPIKFKCF